VIAGGFGIGLVWGWLIGGPNARRGRAGFTSTPLGAIVSAVWVMSAAGSEAVVGFVAGVAVALVARMGWRTLLVHRAGSDREGGTVA
jgi:hypothetical protein